jgi:hypothetical protein
MHAIRFKRDYIYCLLTTWILSEKIASELCLLYIDSFIIVACKQNWI